MKKIILILVIIAAIGNGALVWAQQNPQPTEGPQSPQPPQQGQTQPHRPPPAHDPLTNSLFPPEMVLKNQSELSLTEDQKTFMRGEIQRSTTRFNELQWQLQDAIDLLNATVKGNSVNEQLALSQLDKVLDTEREIKRLHMEMLIRIKNKLSSEQQIKLQTIRQNRPPRDGGPGSGPGLPGRGPAPRIPGGPGPGPGPRPGGQQPRPGGPLVP